MSDEVKDVTQTFLETDKARRVRNIAELFANRDTERVSMPYIATGFTQLDAVLGGGLTPGVHYIGAVSSLGKSTFCLQMADHVASQKHPVVYVSLEMSGLALTAKLISRYSFCQLNNNDARSSSQLVNKSVLNAMHESDWDALQQAIATVQAHGEYLTILEGDTKPLNVDDIVQYIERYVEAYGVAPVVFIDYLQILAPSKRMARSTDKPIVDYNIGQFRLLARRHNTPVVVISSFNRAGYNTEASMADFKESGNIEYSADTLLALQFAGVGTDGFDVNAAKVRDPRSIELVVLKQRYGKTGDRLRFRFFAQYSYFEGVPLTPASGTTVSSPRKHI